MRFHLSYYYLFAPHTYILLFFEHIPFLVVNEHTFNATPRHQRGCKNIPSFLQTQRTAPIARCLCEGWTRHDLHILVTAPLCWRVSPCEHVSSIGESDSLYPSMKWWKRYSGSRLPETKQSGDLRGDTVRGAATRLVGWEQNRHQKVFNRESWRLCWGHDILKVM